MVTASANENARALRKSLTPQEVKLWVKLRELKPLGFHFRRQAPIGRYILDFVSFRSQLIIEADGGQHSTGSDSRRFPSFRKASRFCDFGIRTSMPISPESWRASLARSTSPRPQVSMCATHAALARAGARTFTSLRQPPTRPAFGRPPSPRVGRDGTHLILQPHPQHHDRRGRTR